MLKKRKSGLSLGAWITLIFTIIVFASIIPTGTCSCQIQAEIETKVKDNLRSILAGQKLFASLYLLDQDIDGCGEYGTLVNLSKAYGSEERVLSNLIPKNLELNGEKAISQEGYLFQVFLPGECDFSTPEEVTDAREEYFRCYAWPLEHLNRVQRIFVMDQNGDIYASYSKNKAPKANAVVLATEDTENGWGAPLADKEESKDGGMWWKLPLGSPKENIHHH